MPSIGEIIGGSQREERYEVLVSRIEQLGFEQQDYRWYLDTRRYGTVPHAGVMVEVHQRGKLERLCRYVSRSAVSEKRLALTSNGQVRYELKTPYRNGTTHVIFQPLDFIAKLAALVPKPRVNLTRFHGVFVLNSKHRGQITPAKRGKKTAKVQAGGADWLDKSPEERHRAMTWMQRLKRVFNIDIETCERCGGKVCLLPSPLIWKRVCTTTLPRRILGDA